jgi:hypothetical protein
MVNRRRYNKYGANIHETTVSMIVVVCGFQTYAEKKLIKKIGYKEIDGIKH